MNINAIHRLADQFHVKDNFELPESKIHKITRLAITYLTPITLVVSIVKFVAKRWFGYSEKSTQLDFKKIDEALSNHYFENILDLAKTRKALIILGFNVAKIDNFLIPRILKILLIQKDCFEAALDDDMTTAINMLTADDIELLNLKVIQLILSPGFKIEDLEKYPLYKAILTDETKQWIQERFAASEDFAKRVSILENRKKYTDKQAENELYYLSENAAAVHFEFRRNSREWRHYFNTVAAMIKVATPNIKFLLANGLYRAIDSVESDRESLTDFLDNFSQRRFREILRRPFPEGQNALNIAVACGFIDLSSLIHELAEPGIAEEVINRLTTTMRYHHISLNTQDDQGNTLLHKAVTTQNFPLVKALLFNGASISIKNNESKTAIELGLSLSDPLIHNMLLQAFTTWLAINRIDPVNVLSLADVKTPYGDRVGKGKKVKGLQYLNNDKLQQVVNVKMLSNNSLQAVSFGFDLAGKVLKINEANTGYEALLKELQEQKVKLGKELTSSINGPLVIAKIMQRINELEAEIEAQEKLQKQNEAGHYVGLLATGMDIAQTFASKIPGTGFLSAGVSCYQQLQSGDSTQANEDKDKNTLAFLAEEFEALVNLRDAFANNKFVQLLLGLKVDEFSIKMAYLEKRIAKYETDRTDARIAGGAGLISAASTTIAMTPAAPIAPPLKAVGWVVPLFIQAYRTGTNWIYPSTLPSDADYLPSENPQQFVKKCAIRLGISVDSLDQKLQVIHATMTPENKDWFFELLKATGVTCDREQFEKDLQSYILLFVVN